MAKHRLSVLRNHVNVHDIHFYVCTMIVHRLDVSMGMGFWIDGGGIRSVCSSVDWSRRVVPCKMFVEYSRNILVFQIHMDRVIGYMMVNHRIDPFQ